MAFFRLFCEFILRSLWKEKIRSAVAVLGIALGVAVMVAVRLANNSVTDTFKAAVDSVGGQASLRIRGAAGRFDEQQLRQLTWLSEYGQISPVVEGYAMLDKERLDTSGGKAFPRGEMLQVLGVDVLLDFPMRDYHVLKFRGEEQSAKSSARDALRLLDDPLAVILTEKFLRRHQLRVGDQVPLTFDSKTQNYTIRGVLLDEGPAKTLDGNFALMDIAAAQVAANRLGLIDYVDLMLRPEVESRDLFAVINQRLPKNLVAESPDAASGRADTMVAAFQFNLSALGAVALIVGLFLIYNTVTTSVAARRTEIGMLQAIGSGRWIVLALFLSEALLLATVGLVLGLPAGRLLATGAVGATSQTVEIFYIANVAQASASQLRLSGHDILSVIFLVGPLTLVAAFVPAWEAATIQPIDAVRRTQTGLRPKTAVRLVATAVLAGLLGWFFTRLSPVFGMPIWGFAAEMVFLLAAALMTPLLISAVAKAIYWFSHRDFTASAEFRLAAANLDGSLARVSISVAALAMSLAMMVAIAIMVGSFRNTVTYWLDSALTADLSIKPIMQTSSVAEERLSQETVDIVRAEPMVDEVIWFSSRQITFRDRDIRLAVTEIPKTLARGHILFHSPPDTPRNLERGCVFVSESFSHRFQSPVGAMLELPSPGGYVPFRVAGVYYDYASNQGTVLMDVEDYRQHYAANDPTLTPQTMSIHLSEDADPLEARRRLIRALGPAERVYCVTNGEVRREALRIFESTFTITYALQLIAILVAGLGVASTLITMIYHRRRDIGLLSLCGATPKQLRRVFVIEALAIGASSQLLGILLGIVLALVLIFVINLQSFGWTIQMEFPLGFLLQSSFLVILAAGLFGLYPAIQAASVDPLQTIREEHA
jgi:putative ABC transport system permease protein